MKLTHTESLGSSTLTTILEGEYQEIMKAVKEINLFEVDRKDKPPSFKLYPTDTVFGKDEHEDTIPITNGGNSATVTHSRDSRLSEDFVKSLRKAVLEERRPGGLLE